MSCLSNSSLKLTTLLPVFTLIFPQTAISSKFSMGDLLDMSLQELMNVEITTAGKTDEKIKDIPANVYVVTRNEIEKYGYQTLPDIIQHIPGVYNIYNYTGAPGNFGVRGFWNGNSQNSNIAILVNGIKQRSEFDGNRSHPLEAINILPESIDRIEFIKGPMGVMYGSGASFGVINIITNQLSNNMISASYGERNSRKASIKYSKGNSEKNYVINASTYQTDGLNNKFSEMIGPLGESILTNIGAAIPDANDTTEDRLEHKNQHISISGDYNKWYFDLSYNHTDIESILLVPPVEDGDITDLDSLNTRLGYTTQLNSDLNLNSYISITDYSENRDFDGITPGLIADQHREYQNYEIEILSTYQPTKNFNLVTGLNYLKTDNYYEYTNVPLQGLINETVNFDRNVNTIFTQANYEFDDHWRIIAGLRYEQFKSYNRTVIEEGGQPGESTNISDLGDINSTSPRLSTIYTFNQNHLLKFMYGKSARLSNDRFEAEETETYEVNYLFTQENIYTSLSLFHNNLENLLIDVIFLDNGNIANQRSSQGKITTNGLEMVVRKSFTSKLDGELGFTLQESEDDSSGSSINASYSPDALLHLKSSYTHNDIIYSLRGRYIDSILPLLNRTELDPQGTYIGNEIDSYMVFDFNIRFNNITKNISASISVQNMFDEEIRHPNNLENNEFMDLGTIDAERTIMASINWKF